MTPLETELPKALGPAQNKPSFWWVSGGSHPQRFPWGRKVSHNIWALHALGRRCGRSELLLHPGDVWREWWFCLENTATTEWTPGFMAKLDFRRIWVLFFPFSETSVFPYTSSFPLFWISPWPRSPHCSTNIMNIYNNFHLSHSGQICPYLKNAIGESLAEGGDTEYQVKINCIFW